LRQGDSDGGALGELAFDLERAAIQQQIDPFDCGLRNLTDEEIRIAEEATGAT
jgi:hypothetical protein